MKFKLNSVIMLLTLGGAFYRNDNPPAVIANVATRLNAIDTELKPLFENAMKDGRPDEAIVNQIRALETEGKALLEVKAAAERSFNLSQIPASERFKAEFNLGKYDISNLEKFSLLEACRGVANNRPNAGILNELGQEAQRELASAGLMVSTGDGVAVPRVALEHAKHRAAMHKRLILNSTQSVTGSNLGSQFVQTDVASQLQQWLTLLPLPILQQAGCFQLSGLTGNILIPILSQGNAVVTATENANGTASTSATSSKTIQPRRLPVYVDVSDQLVMQTSPSVDALLLTMLLENSAVAKDQYGINGLGTGSEPTGILNTSGIGSVALGANGAVPTFGSIIDLETAVANANATGNLYLTNSRTRGKLKQTLVTPTYGDRMVWGADNTLNGYRTLVSNTVPNTLVKGASGSVCSAVIFADFAKALMASWGGIMIEKPRDKAGAIAGTGTIVVTEWFDFLVMQPLAFGAIKDSLSG
jgi:HK97 family phage major capsid protein